MCVALSELFKGEEMLSEPDAASKLGLSRHTLRGWRQRQLGLLPFFRFGRAIRYDHEDLKKFYEENRVPKQIGK